MRKIILVLSALLITITIQGCSVTKVSGSREEQNREIAQMIKDRLDGRDFNIVVTRAMPMRGPAVYLTSPYDLTIKGDSVESYLPYFGRASRMPYGGGEGLIFEGTIAEYQSEVTKKGDYRVKFSVRTREDMYSYVIDVGKSGGAMIWVISNNKSSISFSGNINLEEPERQEK